MADFDDKVFDESLFDEPWETTLVVEMRGRGRMEAEVSAIRAMRAEMRGHGQMLIEASRNRFIEVSMRAVAEMEVEVSKRRYFPKGLGFRIQRWGVIR